ncbi:ATPase family protein associated with various cellular activities (AAA) [Heliophilum fasciatum]|uniref:ATPase family protein associated with various cellular activities (AAA) n=2 Tax=Heliophilum fasciatum TaxID=35700 RepID=A0A4R2RTI1_9FIRM|nr:ATPase family protein associated with various cellular activities (AAA) [Heliophilum fasciatum]
MQKGLEMMARADLLKKIFRGYMLGDRQMFTEAANDIIDEERKKAHVILANELTRILENGKPLTTGGAFYPLEPLPKDVDRGTELLEVRQPDRYLDDLILLPEQRECLEEVAHEFRGWDILEANGLRPRHKLLFCGPPGCGKTASAEALSSELGIPLLYVRFDAVVSSLLGETSANLRKVFEYAARGSWVLFFDEFDAIGRSRDDESEHGELKRVVNSFLQMLDRFAGRSLVIAATNFEQSLDPALWRRFDEIIRFDKPGIEQIAQLLRKKLASKGRADISLDTFAGRLSGMSHAEIERICFDVLRMTVLQGASSYSLDDLMKVIKKQEGRKQLLKSIVDGEKPHIAKE